MVSIEKEITSSIVSLVKEGESMYKDINRDFSKERKIYLDKLIDRYQTWYTSCLNVVKEFGEIRLREFIEYYELNQRKELSIFTYTLKDFFSGYDLIGEGKSESVVISKFGLQITILNSISKNVSSKLSNIKGILESELFDDELEAAEELLKKKYYRASGALAGVTLERHLKNICEKLNFKIVKKSASISDYNDTLKKEEHFDLIKWRFIQHLGDLRNLCDHDKEREPTKEDIEKLLKGVKEVVKTYL
jgi:hypothetical protein